MTIDDYSKKYCGVKFCMLDEFEAHEIIKSYNATYNKNYSMVDYWTAKEIR
jgi:hypothetical protein